MKMLKLWLVYRTVYRILFVQEQVIVDLELSQVFTVNVVFYGHIKIVGHSANIVHTL